MHSIITTVNSMNANYLSFGVSGRAQGVKDLPDGYRVASPLVAYTNELGIMFNKKTSEVSLNWIVNDKSLEIINTETGLKFDNTPSRLCKASMFKLFSTTWYRMDPATRCGPIVPMVYKEAKQAVGSYHGSKKQLVDLFTAENQGVWIYKPSEVDSFQHDPKMNNEKNIEA